MSNQSLLKIFVVLMVITTFSMFREETAIGSFLYTVLLIAIVLGLIVLVFATFLQICVICLALVGGKKDEGWPAQLKALNNLILTTGIFYLSFAVSTVIHLASRQTFEKSKNILWHNGPFFFECCILLPLLFLNKRIREDYRWTFLICGLILAGICYRLYHSLDHLSAFGFGH